MKGALMKHQYYLGRVFLALFFNCVAYPLLLASERRNFNFTTQSNSYTTVNGGRLTFSSSGTDGTIPPKKSWPQWLKNDGTWNPVHKGTVNGRLLDMFIDDKYSSMGAYQLDAIEQKLESEYGPLDSPTLNFKTKKKITDKYYELFALFPYFQRNLAGGYDYESLPINPILSKLCRNDYNFYEYVMQCVPGYGPSAGRIEYIEDLLTYNDLIQTTTEMFFEPGYSISQGRRASFGEAGDRLQHLAQLSQIQECAQSEDILQYRKELLPLKVAFESLSCPPELSGSVNLITQWIDNTITWASLISRQRAERSKYGTYPINDPIFIKRLEDALAYLGRKAVVAQHQDNKGIEIHADTKTALIQAIEGVQQACTSKQYPRLEQIEGGLTNILWHSLLESDAGYIVKPSKLLILAQSMALMARSRDIGSPLCVPLSFVQTELLHEHVSDALVRSHSLYLVPPFKSLIQSLPEYLAHFKQLVTHPDQCFNWRIGSPDCAIKVIPEERDEFDKIIQEEKKLRLQEDADEQEFVEQVKLMVEAEIKGYQDSVAKLMVSPLDIIQRKEYIQERERVWQEDREKKIAELENGGQWNKATLSYDALTMIANQGRSAEPFQELVNSAEQQVLQNEFVELANESAQPWKYSPELHGPLPEMMLQFAEAGSRFVMVSDLNSARLVANSGNAMREYFYAFSKGVANGIISAGEDLAGCILHPINLSIEFTNQLYNLSYQLGRVLHVVADIAFSYDLPYEDQLKAWDRGERNAQVLYEDVYAFYKVLKHHYDITPGPKLLEEVTTELMRSYARRLLVGATLNCVGKGANKLAQCVDKIKDHIDPPGYALQPDGTVAVGYAVGQTITAATEAQGSIAIALFSVVSGKGPKRRWEEGESQDDWDYPFDRETFLRQRKNIRPTKYFVKHARVYTDGKRYYHVDTLHKGPGAHIEVYNKSKMHIGTMDPVTGEWLTTKGVPGRRLII